MSYTRFPFVLLSLSSMIFQTDVTRTLYSRTQSQIRRWLVLSTNSPCGVLNSRYTLEAGLHSGHAHKSIKEEKFSQIVEVLCLPFFIDIINYPFLPP